MSNSRNLPWKMKFRDFALTVILAHLIILSQTSMSLSSRSYSDLMSPSCRQTRQITFHSILKSIVPRKLLSLGMSHELDNVECLRYHETLKIITLARPFSRLLFWKHFLTYIWGCCFLFLPIFCNYYKMNSISRCGLPADCYETSIWLPLPYAVMRYFRSVGWWFAELRVFALMWQCRGSDDALCLVEV